MPIKVIVTKPSFTAKSLIDILSAHSYEVMHMPVFEVVEKDCSVSSLSFNSSTAIFLSSPTSIKLIKSWLSDLKACVRLIVPGLPSAKIVKAINNNIEIFFPSNYFGIKGVIASGLLLGIGKLIVFGGDKCNIELVNYCKEYDIDLNFISLYSLVNTFNQYAMQFNQIINANKTCLIISSSGIAYEILRYLTDTSLDNLIIISLHEKITQIIQAKLAVTIVCVYEMSNQAIISALDKLKLIV